MSYQVIARKWRPQTFDDLVGQQHVTETLKNAIKNDRVAHAYIFSGARGVGKTTAARILAKALNCVKGPTAQPCGECDSCKEIAAGAALGVGESEPGGDPGLGRVAEGGAMAVIARMAEGSLRDALSLLEQARAYCGDTISDKEVRELLGVVPDDALDELVGAISEGSANRALGLVHTFQKEGRNLQHFCREAIRHMRNLLIARACGADSDLIAATPDQRPALAKAAALFSEEDLTRFFQILLQTDDDLRRKPDPRVHLEMGLLRLINAARLAPLEELLAEMKSGAPGSVANSAMARGASAAVASTSSTNSVAPSAVNAVSPQPKPETKAHFSSSFATQGSASVLNWKQLQQRPRRPRAAQQARKSCARSSSAIRWCSRCCNASVVKSPK